MKNRELPLKTEREESAMPASPASTGSRQQLLTASAASGLHRAPFPATWRTKGFYQVPPSQLPPEQARVSALPLLMTSKVAPDFEVAVTVKPVALRPLAHPPS